ncbi:MAG: AAA family ATPase [Candidatus Symbiobacter sp.]|nr:AAA family ATPase [Candidatus Symbiobacter sp.]
MMAKIISFFNHKGGVGKTTTVFSLGWMMAELGKRVLLVDFDPQCNLTGLTLKFKEIDDLEQFYTAKPANNVRDALAPAFECQPVLISGAECVQIDKQPNLFILPGHLEMAQYEATLGLAQQLGHELIVLKNIPGSLKYMIDRTAEKYNIDYVLVDLNPSLSPINMNIIMTSDYFIVPMQPDYFSAMAINSLSKALPNWKKWAEKASQTNILREATYPFLPPHVQFAGAIISRFQPYSMEASVLFQKWINQAMKDKFVPKMRDHHMLDIDVFKKVMGIDPSESIVQAKDFKSLMAKSHEENVPIFCLPPDAKGTGTRAITNEGNIQEYYDLYKTLANKIFALSECRHNTSESSKAA